MYLYFNFRLYCFFKQKVLVKTKSSFVFKRVKCLFGYKAMILLSGYKVMALSGWPYMRGNRVANYDLPYQML